MSLPPGRDMLFSMRMMSELSLLTSFRCFLSMSSGAVQRPLYLVCAASYTSLHMCVL